MSKLASNLRKAGYKRPRPTKGRIQGCRCRKPKTHRDCMYCGCGWAGEVICGMCKENGIDGKLIRGTGRVVCRLHRKG